MDTGKNNTDLLSRWGDLQKLEIELLTIGETLPAEQERVLHQYLEEQEFLIMDTVKFAYRLGKHHAQQEKPAGA